MTDVMRRGATTATATAVAYNRDLFPGLRVRAHTHFLDERRTRRRLGDWPWTFTRPIVQGHSDFSADGTPSTPAPAATSAIFIHTHIRGDGFVIVLSLFWILFDACARLIIIKFVSAYSYYIYAIRRRFNKPRKRTTLLHYVWALSFIVVEIKYAAVRVTFERDTFDNRTGETSRIPAGTRPTELRGGVNNNKLDWTPLHCGNCCRTRCSAKYFLQSPYRRFTYIYTSKYTYTVPGKTVARRHVILVRNRWG